MKWTIFGLIAVGIIAALSAATLTATFRAGMSDSEADEPTELEVMVATTDLPPMSVVDASKLVSRTVMSNEAPEGAVTSPVQVIGQVLVVAMQEGEVFTKKSFARDESKLHMAAALPAGARAMCVVLDDDTGIADLLYPGCMVDVVASFRMPSGRGTPPGEVVSVTLLQGLQVLSVGADSIVGEEGAVTAAPGKVDGRRRHVATLMVNMQQAEALQLASQHGRVSLVLRNPLDADSPMTGGVALSDLSDEIAQRLARFAGEELSSAALVAPVTTETMATPTGMSPPANTVAAQDTPADQTQHVSQARRWTTVILRGRASETRSFPIDDPEAAQE